MNNFEKLLQLIPDKTYLEMMYIYHTGHFANLMFPQLFTEKLQWLKINNRHLEYSQMVDKIEAKEYAGEIIGKEHIIPLLFIWDKAEDIDVSMLPEKFVLKTNHDSKGVIVCQSKSFFDVENAKVFFEKRLKKNGYWYGREWPYKNVKPKVFAEQYMEDKETGELRDYKFFCFGGIPFYCQVMSGRFEDETIDFYDMEWNHQVFTGVAKPYKPFNQNPISCPKTFELMKESCKKLAKNQPFLRIDFYEIDAQMFFGELTFYPASGFGSFAPDEWNKKLGDLIDLSKIRL